METCVSILPPMIVRMLVLHIRVSSLVMICSMIAAFACR